jgi:hypothetical protein
MTRQDIPYLERLKEELVRSITSGERAPTVSPARPAGGWLHGRRALLLAGAAAAVIALGVSAAVFLGADEVPAPVPRPDDRGETGVQASCVEPFTGPESLRAREFALDGTIVGIEVPVEGDGEDLGEPTLVTLQVGRWFKGGESDRVTLKTYSRPGVVTSAGGGFPLEEGARVLVSGDGGFIWDCGGYSVPYTPENARIFDDAFRT